MWYVRKRGRKQNNAGTDKGEEKKLPGTMAKKKLPAKGCSRRTGKREEGSLQKKISDARQLESGRGKENARTEKEEKKKLALPLTKKELPTGGCSRRTGKREEGSLQKKISDDRQHHDKWTVCKYEKEG